MVGASRRRCLRTGSVVKNAGHVPSVVHPAAGPAPGALAGSAGASGRPGAVGRVGTGPLRGALAKYVGRPTGQHRGDDPAYLLSGWSTAPFGDLLPGPDAC